MQRESTLDGLHLFTFLALQHSLLALATVCGISFVFLQLGKSLIVMQPVLDFTLLGQKSFLRWKNLSKVASISLKMAESTFIFMTSATCHLEIVFGRLGVVLLICCFVFKVCKNIQSLFPKKSCHPDTGHYCTFSLYMVCPPILPLPLF